MDNTEFCSLQQNSMQCIRLTAFGVSRLAERISFAVPGASRRERDRIYPNGL